MSNVEGVRHDTLDFEAHVGNLNLEVKFYPKSPHQKVLLLILSVGTRGRWCITIKGL